MKTIKCPSCGGSFKTDISDRRCVYCNYCGEQILIDPQRNNMTFNHNINIRKDVTIRRSTVDETEIKKAESAERSKTIEIIACFAITVICLLGLVIMGVVQNINTEKAIKEGKIRAGKSRDYINQQYDAVEKQLEAAGFTNIEIIDLNEPGLLGVYRNKVKSISIGGQSEFDNDDWFYTNDKIIICHH